MDSKRPIPWWWIPATGRFSTLRAMAVRRVGWCEAKSPKDRDGDLLRRLKSAFKARKCSLSGWKNNRTSPLASLWRGKGEGPDPLV